VAIADLILAYRTVKIQKAQQEALKRVVGKDPDYVLIQHLIDKARADIIAEITFPNGTILRMKRADAFDKLKDQMDPELLGAF